MGWLRKLRRCFETPVQFLARLRDADRQYTDLQILNSAILQTSTEVHLREFMTQTAMQVAVLTDAIEGSGIEIREKYRMSKWLDQIEAFQEENTKSLESLRSLMKDYEAAGREFEKKIEGLKR